MILTISGVEAPVETMVDTDGEVRIGQIGGVAIAGMTLNEAEETLAQEMLARGLYVDPQVSVVITAYAPVIVAGDVGSPGRHDYFPGMTVASAVAISGGSVAGSVNRIEVTRARALASSQMREANLKIAAAVAKLARVRAQLAGDEARVELTSELAALLPSAAAVDLDRLIEGEAEVLASERERSVTLLAFWDEEIKTITHQAANFDDRIEAQRAISEVYLKALEDARSLQERGLQTSTRVSDAVENEATARSKILELETAKLNATRAISSAERERASYLTEQREAALGEQNELLAELDTLRVEYDRAAELTALLSGGQTGALLDESSVVVDYALQSSRPGRSEGAALTPNSPIFPGETLIVAVRPVGSDLNQ
ncbi:polysaccharide biosynthesis/export family protein [Salipiger pacificus]|uniref:Polysaccharide biosynthesis/export family protein n=1 Tax=Salipiger mangrovisoli TaxID=2865933 RepID=A0ABR9X0M9_9RHOB|nr:polysaccharide biosynthesis/export family protein [Salipiger mangrovisoli]